MTMMPRGRGQNDAAVKSHPRRCSERHKEDAKAACPRLLCANTKYTIASLVSNDEKAKVVVLLRALLVTMLCCLEHTTNERVSTKKTKKKRERERGEKLSHTHKSKKVCLFDCFVSTRKMHRSIARVVQNDCMYDSSFSSDFLSLSLDKKPTTQF